MFKKKLVNYGLVAQLVSSTRLLCIMYTKLSRGQRFDPVRDRIFNINIIQILILNINKSQWLDPFMFNYKTINQEDNKLRLCNLLT